MFGIIHVWRVQPDQLAEHASLTKAISLAERQRCPELLLNLTFGPASDGTIAQIQVFTDGTASREYRARVAREELDLARLWALREELYDPDGSQSFQFEGMESLSDGFVRQAAGIGLAEQGQPGSGARLKGKVAIVTGGAQGNGKGIALAMAREGADIALVDLSRERAQAAAGEIEALGRRCLVIEADVSSEPAVQQLVATIVEQLGGLDILVNNAGIFPFKPVEQFTLAEFSRVLEVNLIAPWLCAKYAFPELKRRGGGAIVNITSCSGHYGGASVGGTAYDSSKGGLRQMTASLAAEFGPHQVRVNAIAPGVVVTEGTGGPKILESEGGKREMARTPLRRLGFPVDVGRVAVFLASDDASYVNGVTVILDGGAMAVW